MQVELVIMNEEVAFILFPWQECGIWPRKIRLWQPLCCIKILVWWVLSTEYVVSFFLLWPLAQTKIVCQFFCEEVLAITVPSVWSFLNIVNKILQNTRSWLNLCLSHKQEGETAWKLFVLCRIGKLVLNGRRKSIYSTEQRKELLHCINWLCHWIKCWKKHAWCNTKFEQDIELLDQKSKTMVSTNN